MLKINNVKEAWDFLTKEIHQKGGEFRIHTNKNGIRLYLLTDDPMFCGYRKKYFILHSDGVSFYHKDVFSYEPCGYSESILEEDLTTALNLHLKNFSGFTLNANEKSMFFRRKTSLSKENFIKKLEKNYNPKQLEVVLNAEKNNKKFLLKYKYLIH
jgi:hypothetical protein